MFVNNCGLIGLGVVAACGAFGFAIRASALVKEDYGKRRTYIGGGRQQGGAGCRRDAVEALVCQGDDLVLPGRDPECAPAGGNGCGLAGHEFQSRHQ